MRDSDTTTLRQVPRLKIVVASPCQESWDDMNGDEKKRFCSKCKLNVHNVSQMNKDEIEELLTNSKGRVCGRIYQRRDGTVITKDCPVGRKTKRKKIYIVSVLLSFLGLSGLSSAPWFNSFFPEKAIGVPSDRDLDVHAIMGEIVYIPPESQ